LGLCWTYGLTIKQDARDSIKIPASKMTRKSIKVNLSCLKEVSMVAVFYAEQGKFKTVERKDDKQSTSFDKILSVMANDIIDGPFLTI
jgi:hypothetical protein